MSQPSPHICNIHRRFLLILIIGFLGALHCAAYAGALGQGHPFVLSVSRVITNLAAVEGRAKTVHVQHGWGTPLAPITLQHLKQDFPGVDFGKGKETAEVLIESSTIRSGSSVWEGTFRVRAYGAVKTYSFVYRLQPGDVWKEVEFTVLPESPDEP